MKVRSIQEFAERVLFSDRLEDKLAEPEMGDWIWNEESPKIIQIPDEPTRPQALRFSSADQQRVPYPKDQNLERLHERGALLHFLANHELLAVELMALALLKFPDAPKAFRRGAVKTLMDEQRHTRDYMKRMSEFGVEFGSFQVNGFFWKMVADMSDPMDYVTRLSLTFEQANLDHSLHYSKLMSAIGDEQSASLLRQIYQDEIGHVGFGWRWFQKWKDPDRSNWENYKTRLHFPLSPGRAKGVGKSFNTEGRQRSGLTQEFIQEIQLFQQSRGRAPDVYWFNPSSESYIAEGLRHQPKKAKRHFARDLRPISLMLARQDDLALLDQAPSREYLVDWQSAGVVLPEWTVFDPEQSRNGFPKGSDYTNRKLRGLRPWSWSPESEAWLSPMRSLCSESDVQWTEKWKPISSKDWSAEIAESWTLEHLKSHSGREQWLAPSDIYGQLAKSESEALELALALRQSSGYPAVAYKSRWGSSGQGTRRFIEESWTDPLRGWIRDRIAVQGGIVVEPWLERVVDLSFHWDLLQGGEVRFRGIAEMNNTANGEYRSTSSGPALGPGLSPEVKRFIFGSPGDSKRLFQVMDSVGATLAKPLRALGYAGPVGVDTFIHRDPHTQFLRFKPIVEINPRYSMGRLTLELKRFGTPASTVTVRVAQLQDLELAGCENWSEFWSELKRQHPMRLEGSPTPKLASGVLPVSDPETANRFFCYALWS